MKLTPLQKYKKDLYKALRSAHNTDWFERYINKSRGQGNTDALIFAARQRSATIITHNAAFAEQIHEQHKVKTSYVGSADFAIRPTRSVVDNAAILALVQESKKIQALAERLLTLLEQKGID